MKPANCTQRDHAIPECYAANIPYIRACSTSAKHTSRGAYDKKGSSQKQRSSGKEGKLRMCKEGRAKAGSRPERVESEKADRAESKAENHTFQNLVYRQGARGYTRG